jgi:putative ABC transport system permease protein
LAISNIEMETLFKDIRYGIRSLLKQPGFTTVVVITLALGIGVNTAIFSLVHAVLLRPLPFADSNRLVVVKAQNEKTGETLPSVSPADFFDWKSQSQSYSNLAAYSGWSITLLDGEVSELIPATRVTDEFFSTLGVPPLLGRTFTPDEFNTGSSVVILSHRLWLRRFGGDPNIITKTLALAQGRVTVVGVMPAQFKLPASAEAWTPVAQDSGEMHLRAARYFETVARLKPKVTPAQAEAEMRTIAARLASQYSESDSNWSVRLATLRETLVGDSRLPLLILLGAVSLVLLIACGNVANLMLARTATRHRELAIRAALGASRWQILRQLIIESLLLSGIASALGLLLALWSVNAIIWLVPKDLRFPRIEETQVNLTVLFFALAVGLLVSVALGLISGLNASRPTFRNSLAESSRSVSAGVRLQRLRGALVVAEISLTLVLLAGAGLLIKSLMKLQQVDLGFNHDRLLVVPVGASMPKYAEPQMRAAFFERLAGQVQTVPGVRSVTTSSCPPLMHTMFFPFGVEGKANPNEVPQAWFSMVSPNYFDVMHIASLAGRSLTDQDRFGATQVAIINDTMRRRFFASEDPIGKRLVVSFLNTKLTVEIVGVVSDIKQESLSAPANAQIYLSYLQVPWFSTALLVRTEVDPSTLIAPIERALRSIDPAQSGSGTKTMEQLLTDSVAQPRFYSLLLGSFAGLALVLAMVGVYGVISYSVAQRTHELGIRIALGARVQHVLILVMGQAMMLVMMGAVIGLGIAFALTRLLTKFLFDVKASDPMTFGAVALLLALVALFACYVPARRATKVDPLVALHYE